MTSSDQPSDRGSRGLGGHYRRWLRDPKRGSYYIDILAGWILLGIVLDIVIGTSRDDLCQHGPFGTPTRSSVGR